MGRRRLAVAFVLASWAAGANGQAGDSPHQAAVQALAWSAVEPVALRKLDEEETPILVIGRRPQTAAPEKKARHVTVTFTLVPTGSRPTLVDRLAHDRTLRRGDAVMTPLGVRVFEGRESTRHEGRDFVPLGAAQSVTAADRRVLDAVDRLPRPAPDRSVADRWMNFGPDLAVASEAGRTSEMRGGCVKGGARVSCF